MSILKNVMCPIHFQTSLFILLCVAIEKINHLQKQSNGSDTPQVIWPCLQSGTLREDIRTQNTVKK